MKLEGYKFEVMTLCPFNLVLKTYIYPAIAEPFLSYYFSWSARHVVRQNVQKT